MSIIASPELYLSQGDIFHLLTVAPYGDTEVRVFRTEDGRHGSIAFETGVNSRVFDLDELNGLVLQKEPHPHRIAAFKKSPNLTNEFVVVQAYINIL